MMTASEWARETFGQVDLGDRRRTARLVRVAASAAQSPAGTVTKVFSDDAERQGAYDFLESEHIDADELEAGAGNAVATKCGSEAKVLVVVDGSSLSFVDRTGGRGLGAVGSYAAGGVGLKVITALALTSKGVPIGPVRQVMWRRPAQRPTNRRPAKKRPVDKKETQHWLEAVTASKARLAGPSAATRITYLVDREGDSAAMLSTLLDTEEGFIVRGNWDRTVEDREGRKRKVRDHLAVAKLLGEHEVELSAQPGRAARTARVMVRAVEVAVTVKNPVTGKIVSAWLTAVNAREMGTAPTNEDPLDWLLLTNRQATSLAAARAAVADYALRWRIEEFHRSWKSGYCNVEESQLRSEQAIKKWALVLAAVACRVERLKLLARTTPTLPASMEFSEIELHALVLLKKRIKKRDEVVAEAPSLEEATLWLAQLGGYTGKSSGGPPGTITISRGLARLRDAADAIAAFIAKDDDENG